MYLIDKNDVLWKEMDGTVTVLSLATGDFFELNQVGGTVWKLIAEGHNPEEIAHLMKKNYNAPLERIRKDTNLFIDDMLSKGIIKKLGK
jgi:hypothetical protein